MTRTMDDPFSAFPELAPYQLFAGDGHWHAAAAHDPRDHKGAKHATLFALRGGTPKGTPVILVWDRAIIDYRFVQKVKDQGGLYFITRPKSNSNLTRSGFHDIARIPVNEGVLSDELVAPAGTGRCLRRITWQDPDSGETWQYLTNEMKLRPGLIVHYTAGAGTWSRSAAETASLKPIHAAGKKIMGQQCHCQSRPSRVPLPAP